MKHDYADLLPLALASVRRALHPAHQPARQKPDIKRYMMAPIDLPPFMERHSSAFAIRE